MAMRPLERKIAQGPSDTDTQCHTSLVVPRRVHVRLLRLSSALPLCSLAHQLSIAGWARNGRAPVCDRELYAIPSLMLSSCIATWASTFLRARVHGACEHLYAKPVVRICAAKIRPRKAKRLSLCRGHLLPDTAFKRAAEASFVRGTASAHAYFSVRCYPLVKRVFVALGAKNRRQTVRLVFFLSLMSVFISRLLSLPRSLEGAPATEVRIRRTPMLPGATAPPSSLYFAPPFSFPRLLLLAHFRCARLMLCKRKSTPEKTYSLPHSITRRFVRSSKRWN